MTKEEAYNAMQEGLCVSHKDFAENEFLYMDENYIIKDENGDEFESTWDVKTSDRWLSDWYIYKGVGSKKRKLLHTESKDTPYMISHIFGKSCPGKSVCLQFNQVGETACILCDTNDNKQAKLPEDVKYLIEDNDGESIIVVRQKVLDGEDTPPKAASKPLTLFQKIKLLFKRGK